MQPTSDDKKQTTDELEAMWIRALEDSDFCLARHLLTSGFTPRADLAYPRDLTAEGRAIFDRLPVYAPDLAKTCVTASTAR